MNTAVNPPSDDAQVEQEIQRKGLTAPRVTPHEIEALADGIVMHSHHFPGTTCTVSIAVLANGFVAGFGRSASVSLANFDAGIGLHIAEKNARHDAIDKLWELEGYAIKKRISEPQA